MDIRLHDSALLSTYGIHNDTLFQRRHYDSVLASEHLRRLVIAIQRGVKQA